MRLYHVLSQVQEACNELCQHRCDANNFESAYWQEHQKLNEALKVNKDLGVQLEGAQSTIDNYKQRLIPDSLRAQKDAEQYAFSLASKLELQEARLKRVRDTGLSDATDDIKADKIDEVPRESLETQAGRVKEEVATGRANRAKLRRLAKAALSESS